MKAIGLAGLLALGACAHPAPPPIVPPSDQDACGAGKVQDLIGQSAANTVADAKTRSGAERVRTYRNGDPVTMDFSPTRLNIETNAAGRIVRLSCG